MATATATAEKKARAASAKIDEKNVQEKVERIRDDIAGLKSALTAYGTDKAGELTAAARETANDVSDQARQALDSASRELAILERQIADHVRRKPIQSLGIAAAVGVIAALLMRR